MDIVLGVGKLILFTAIAGLIFSIASLPTDAYADHKNKKKSVFLNKIKDIIDELKNDPKKIDDIKSKIKDKLKEIKDERKGGTLIPLSTICFDKTLQEWMDDGFKVIRGTDGNDRLKGKGKPEVIAGGPGNDFITAAGKDDIVCGGPGNDTILGGEGDDKLDGGEGDDTIKGGGGEDLVIGGPGEDTLRGGEDNDLIEAQDLELDNIHGGNPKADTDICVVDEVEEKIKGCEIIITPYNGA